MWLKGVVMCVHFNGLIPKKTFAQFHISPNVMEREFLTEDELKAVMTHEFADSKLAYIRDIFVFASFTALSAYSFMIFNLLCAPCFAAMGAIKREMNNGKWTAIAIGYMCALAYCAALVVYQLGGLITGEIGFNFFTIVAAVVLVAFIYLMVRPNKYAGNNEVKIDVTKI